MKKVLFTVLAIIAYCTATNAQSIIDGDDQRNPNDFYQKGIVVGKKAMPYPSVRENDVIWESVIWREIDYNEKFNQFFYFPTDESKQTQGRINLVNLIVNAVKNGDIPSYEDDDMVREYDVAEAMKHLFGEARTKKIALTDADGQPIYDPETDEIMMKDTVIDATFNNESATRIQLKEEWYIDKQDTRQKVRIVGLMFHYKKTMEGEGGQDREVDAESFWIPMDDMRVRQVLVNANIFDEHNEALEKSYDDVFIQRRFDSYVVRDSNTPNRFVSDYLTGIDAILESQNIEDMIFDIESDMWEY